MKNLKKVITVGTIVLTMGVTSIVGLAATAYKTPAEIVSGLTGKTVENVISERGDSNKSYGLIAAEAGKLEEFKKENFEMKKDILQTQVKEGKISQEEADTIVTKIEDNQKKCDGTGSGRIGRKEGARFGSNGLGQGLVRDANLEREGLGRNQEEGRSNKGQREGRGQGGMRLGDGTCHNSTK